MARRIKTEQTEFVPIGGPSRVQTHHADDLDMNKVIARIRRGAMPPAVRHPIFMEVVSEDYLEMVNFVRDAQDEFMRFPSKVRSRFANDPYQLIRFLEDERNYDEAVKLGLIQPVKEGFHPDTPKSDPAVDPRAGGDDKGDSGTPKPPNPPDDEAQPRKESKDA